MSVLVWVQTVCKGYQQMTKVTTLKERIKKYNTISSTFLPKIKVSSLKNLLVASSCTHKHFCIHVGTPPDFFYGSFFLFVSVFDILPCLCPAALWSPAGKGLTSRRLCM